jgi:hypothetical protein
MSVSPEDVTAAEARTKAARARLLETLGRVQERLRPSHLAQDAVESAAQGVASVARKGAHAVRSRPLAVAAFAGTIGLVMARGWIADIVAGHRIRGHETPAKADGLKKKSAKIAKKGTAG